MTCAKKVVICTIIADNGSHIVGTNDCLNPQKTCPRLPGEGYTKCKTICDQPGHAEEMALFKLALFKLALFKLATTVRARQPLPNITKVKLTGINRVCGACKILLKDAGVSEVDIEGKVTAI